MIRDLGGALAARIALASAAAASLALTVASCGHGAQSVSPGPGSSGTQAVQFHIVVPTPAPHVLAGPRAGHTVEPFYVSSGTTQAGVTVTPQGGVPYPTVYFSCTSVSCTGTVDAPVGTDTFLVSLYGGSRISPDTLLSTGTAVAAIQAGVTNTVDLTFDPVVSSIALSLNPSRLAGGVPGQSTVSIDATDATGNTVVGPGGYVNSAGQALSIDLSTVDKLQDGKTAHDTSLSSAVLNGPPTSGPTQVTLSYNGDANLAQTTVSAQTTVAINGTITPATLIVGATPSPTPTGCTVTATPQPTATFFLVPPNAGNPLDAVGDSIAAGPDGNLWTSDGSRRIFRVHTSGAMDQYTIPGAGASSAVAMMAAGPAGGTTVWYADYFDRVLGRITVGTSPSITTFAAPDIETGKLAQPAAVAAGPDGNVWFTDRGSDYLGSISPLVGAFNEYAIPTNNTRDAQGEVVLPNGQLWFVESGKSGVAFAQISALQLGITNAITDVRVPSARQYELRFIAASPDGNIWVTETLADKVARIDVHANPIAVDEFAVPTPNSQPLGIAAGPDGAMWFTESAKGKIGRIPFAAAAGTVPQEYAYPFALPAAIATGADCSLWVTDQLQPRGRVAKISF